MFYELYGLIKVLLQYDSYYHVAKRIITTTQFAAHFGVALIEYGKMKSDVIWKRNIPPNYIEEIIRINQNHFIDKQSNI